MTYHLEGTYIGDILVVERLPKQHMSKHMWKCKCLCGNYFQVTTSELITTRQSCGACKWHIKHKAAYISWEAMKQRCSDSNRKDYKYYGGRKITYDPRWNKFTEFYKDMGDPPIDVFGERLTLDRKDVNGNYNKDNCKWSTRSEQQLNKQQKYLSD